MKFKIYPWNAIYKQPNYFDIHFYFIPSIDICINKYDFPADEDNPIRRKGSTLCIMFSWLLWGITFDFRFGTGTGYFESESGNDLK